MNGHYMERFNISGKVCVITGGGGLIGQKHAEAVLEGGGVPVLLDITQEGMTRVRNSVMKEYNGSVIENFVADITDREALCKVREELLKKYGHIDVLINNAANNPKVEGGAKNLGAIQFRNFPIEMWNHSWGVLLMKVIKKQ